MADRFANKSSELNSPYTAAFTITTNGAAFAQSTRGIYVGVTGNVALTLVDKVVGNTSVLLVAVPAGTMLNVRAIGVSNTSTANSMVAFY